MLRTQLIVKQDEVPDSWYFEASQRPKRQGLEAAGDWEGFQGPEELKNEASFILGKKRGSFILGEKRGWHLVMFIFQKDGNPCQDC